MEIKNRFLTSSDLSPAQRVDPHQFGLWALLNAIPDCIFIKDGSGRWIDVNFAGLDLFDLKGVDYKGKKDSELGELVPFHLEALKYCESTDQAAWAHGSITRSEETVPKSDGTFRTFDVIKVPIFNSDGSRKLMAIVGRDITEYKEAQKALILSEKRHKTLGELIKYGIWTCDPRGSSTYTSESFLSLLGTSPEEFYCKGLGPYIHPEDREEAGRTWKNCLKTGVHLDRELRVRGVDQQWHPVLLRGVPVRNDLNEISSWVGFCIDTKRIKKIEEDLRSALNARDEFLSIASHELKTPMTSLYLELQLLNQFAKRDVAAAKEWKTITDLAIQNCQRLSRLVTDLLDCSMIRAGKFKLSLEKVDFRTQVTGVVSRMATIADSSNSSVTVHARESIFGMCDPNRLDQIITNLLSNAIKYGKGRPIEVKLERSGQALARLTVKDQGIGIRPEMLERIFNRFDRAEIGGNISGLGLGLYIVKHLVEAHHGKISVCSEVGVGTEFVVQLPLIEPEAEKKPAKA